ncbi:hypothetical protein T484DRAFT_1609927, partial [Baffinella frigidus]
CRVVGSWGCMVVGLQECRVQGCRVVGLKGCRVVGSSGCRVAGLQGPRVVGLKGGRGAGLPRPAAPAVTKRSMDPRAVRVHTRYSRTTPVHLTTQRHFRESSSHGGKSLTLHVRDFFLT